MKTFLVFEAKRYREYFRRFVWESRRHRSIEKYMEANACKKLHIGAGPNFFDGWLNTDLNPLTEKHVFLDATDALPFRDKTFDYIYSEHLIEHLDHRDGVLLLGECFRTLKPGGKLRIATPDFERFMGFLSDKKTKEQERYIEWYKKRYLQGIDVQPEIYIINSIFHNWGHQFVYDERTLEAAMLKAGFKSITRYNSGESDDPVFAGIERHGKAIGNEETNRYETMVLEAVR